MSALSELMMVFLVSNGQALYIYSVFQNVKQIQTIRERKHMKKLLGLAAAGALVAALALTGC